VNQLFGLAQGEFLVLPHDDNFLPIALEVLLKPLQKNPAVVASFGMEYLATHAGIILENESFIMNERYFRIETELQGRCYHQSKHH
jgi:hypothetical protein